MQMDSIDDEVYVEIVELLLKGISQGNTNKYDSAELTSYSQI